jgi:hypothetical protein
MAAGAMWVALLILWTAAAEALDTCEYMTTVVCEHVNRIRYSLAVRLPARLALAEAVDSLYRAPGSVPSVSLNDL